jgi:hypothetical protein
MSKFEQMVSAYCETAIWSSLHDSGELPTAEYNDPTQTLTRQAVKDCKEFLADNRVLELLETVEPWRNDAAQIGYDLWLNRNGHGSGFWSHDNVAEVVSDYLSRAAKALGEVDLYLGDDGLLYQE